MHWHRATVCICLYGISGILSSSGLDAYSRLTFAAALSEAITKRSLGAE